MINGSNIPMASDYSDLKAMNSKRPLKYRELIFMQDRLVALTDDGVFEVENNTIKTQILDADFSACDVYGSWPLEIQFHINSEQPYLKEYYSAKANPERLMATEFYEALADLEAAYPEQKETVLQILIALYGSRSFYCGWSDENCWKRAMTFYTFDQMEVPA